MSASEAFKKAWSEVPKSAAQAAEDVSHSFNSTVQNYSAEIDSIKSVTTKAIKAVGVAAGAALVGSAKIGIDFESAFAGVKKTVNATEAELKTLRSGIRDMAKEIPTAATEIAGIAESAGQLGIKTENIMSFTRVMADLGVATNLAGEEAASTLAKFANITQMPQEQFSNLGSTIVALGNNLATTEADIAAMALRLAGAGTQAGLSEAQILSFAGALSSVGIEAEAGGSAFSRVMTDIQLAVETNGDSLKDYAKVAGMSAAEFKDAFQKDAAGAIIEFIKGLNNTERNGKSATQVLAEMGIEEIRLSDALKRAAGASDVFENAIKLGNTAWKENNALTKEAQQRYATTESKIKILGNQVKDLGITAWDAFSGPFGDAVDTASDKVTELSASMSNGELSGAIQNVGTLFGSLVDSAVTLAEVALPPLISVLGFAGEHFGVIAGATATVTGAILAYKAATSVATVVQTAYNAAQLAHAAGCNGLQIAIGLVNGQLVAGNTLSAAKAIAEGSAAAGTAAHAAAQATLNTAMSLNPVGLVIAGLTALVGVTAAVVIGTQKAREEYLNMGDALDETSEKFTQAKESANMTEDYAARWRELNSAISEGKLPAEERAQAEAELKGIEQWFIDNYGSYISAEEQKNGIRETTIGLIEEEVGLLEESVALELERQTLTLKRDMPRLSSSINTLKNEVKVLNETNDALRSQDVELQKALNKWSAWDPISHTSQENLEKEAELLDELNSSLGTNYANMGIVAQESSNLSIEIDRNTKSIEDKNSAIEDGTDSLQSYADASRKLIETELGTELGVFADKYQRINQALLDIENTGSITETTMKGLKDNFPDVAAEIEKSEDPGKTLNTIMETLKTKLDNAKTKANELGTELNGLPKDITIDVKLNVPDVPKFAGGTRRASKGLAVVNDGTGPELIQSKNGSFRMVESNGAALTWLNQGDRVYTAEQTRAIMRRVPHYAGGVGNGAILTDADLEKVVAKLGDAFIKGLKENDKKNTEKFDDAVDVLKFKREFGGLSDRDYYAEMARLRDKYLSDSTKEWFEATEEIYKYDTEAAKDALDYKRDNGLISEERYIEELKAYRDAYYNEDSERYRELTEEINRTSRENELDMLEYRKDIGLLSEREYYEELEKYRNKYFAEGSKEWYEYTQDIYSYYSSALEDIQQEMESMLEEVEEKQDRLADKFKSFGALTRTVTVRNWNEDGSDYSWTELKDFSKETKLLKEYTDNVGAIRDRLSAGDYGSEFINNFISQMADMSAEEGSSYAALLMDATDDEFYEYISGYQTYLKAQEENATAFFKGEMEDAANEAEKYLREQLKEAGFQVPEEFTNIGIGSGKSFADGFKEGLGNLFEYLRDNILYFTPESAVKPSYNGNTYTTTYQFFSNSDTTAEQIQTAQAHSERVQLSGGY
ncbi:MAG: phage tail tape measure protein [Clostridia bacterium]|nr:phage tail tape measure protein [Clostridia bacterium]